ncbi:hypothetical protein ACLKA6_004507 [Drosophila palustris]
MLLKWEFQQDKQLFSQENISVMECPAQSPDLNPIEPLWSSKTGIRGSQVKKPARALGKDTSGLVWHSQETCAKLVDSTGRRCSEVLKVKGFGHALSDERLSDALSSDVNERSL